MPFAKGTPKPANSGRKKGSAFRHLRGTVDAILNELGCNPIAGLAEIAMDKDTEPGIKVRAYAELAQYQHPKRRAIELTGVDGGPIETMDVSPSELLESRIASLATSLNPAGGDSESEPNPDRPD